MAFEAWEEGDPMVTRTRLLSVAAKTVKTGKW